MIKKAIVITLWINAVLLLLAMVFVFRYITAGNNILKFIACILIMLEAGYLLQVVYHQTKRVENLKGVKKWI